MARPGHRTKGKHKPRLRATPRLPDDDRKYVVMSDEAVYALEHWQQHVEDPLFVYFISEDNMETVKVGKAKDPLKRLATLQCGNSRHLWIDSIILATDRIERHIHNQFKECNIHGEWFGHGYAQVIYAFGLAAMEAQISQHEIGCSLREVTELADEMLWELVIPWMREERAA